MTDHDDLLLLVREIDPFPGDVEVPAEWVEQRPRLEEITGRRPLPLRPLRSRRGPLVAAVTAAAVVLLIGGVAFLARFETTEPTDQSTVTTDPTEMTDPTVPEESTVTTVALPPLDTAVLGPGSWSAAATFADPVSTEVMLATAAAVRSWPGVLEVAVAADAAAWRQLTGLESDCQGNNVGPPCGPGLVALVVNTWAYQTALRMEQEHGMTAIPIEDTMRLVWQGYTNAAFANPGPLPLNFDPSSLGEEVPLRGPFDLRSVEIDVDGVPVRLAVGTGRGRLNISENGGDSRAEAHLFVDASGHGGVLVSRRGNSGLDSPIGPRRLYALGALPAEAAVVTFELVDGTRVWQRPVAGLALFVDRVGSLPDGYFVGTGDDFESALDAFNSFTVLDADGVEIIRIEAMSLREGDDAVPVVTDLRLDPAVIAAIPETTPVTPGAGPQPEITDVIPVAVVADPNIGRPMVDTGDALWVAARSGDQRSIARIDRATRNVTDTIAIDGRIWSLAATPDAVWVLLRDRGTVARIDATLRTITDTIEVPGPTDTLYPDLIVAGGGVWVAYETGFARIDPDTLLVEEYPGEGRVDRRWLGEIDGGLWLQTPLTRIDLNTREVEHYGIGGWAGFESVLGEDAIWLINEELARFDLETREVTDRLVLPSPQVASGVYADGAVWVASPELGTVTRYDAVTAEVTDVLLVGGHPAELIVGDDGALWTTQDRAGTVSRIDPASRQLTHVIDVGGVELWHFVAFDGAVWVRTTDAGTLTRIEAP